MKLREENTVLDNDGDGIYTMVVNREIGFTSHFTWPADLCRLQCKEDVSGQPCGDANNFNDRRMQPVTQDTVVNVVSEMQRIILFIRY